MVLTEPHRLHNFIVGELCDRLITDIYNFEIYNEADLQSKVFYHLYNRIKKAEKQDEHLILNKPSLFTRKGFTKYPDLVICKNYTFKRPDPIVAIELKFNLQNFPAAERDIEKLETIKKDYDTVRKGYFLFVYDDDQIWRIRREDNWMKHYFFDASINVRRHKDSGYIRKGYEEWKQSYETVGFDK